MPSTSPLASLYQVLLSVCTSAESNSALLRKNEAATRAALIDPVLRALGWDTANVQVVEPEKTISTTWRADYALYDIHGNIVLLIEAKCLGTDLEKYSVVQQLLSYAFGFGTPQVLITDGIDWHFYQGFKPGNSQTAANFSLAQDNLVDCVLQLSQWLDAARSGHGIITISNNIGNFDKSPKSHTPHFSELKNSNQIPEAIQFSVEALNNTLSLKTIYIKLGETYYNKGFFNVSQEHSDLFGDDNSSVTIYLGIDTNKKIKGDINRRANTHGAPRIFGKKLLRNWIKENFKLNDIMKLDVISSNTILLYK